MTLVSEGEVETWFKSVAGILRAYGRSVLTNEPGAFARLAAAAKERDRMIGERNDQLYGIAGQTTQAG